MLEAYQKSFIEFAIAQNVLQFGDYELKSGRRSPYFFNAGGFQTGQALTRLGEYYSQALISSELKFDLLFGPAYKGIPLVVSTAMALSSRLDKPIPYVFNRKEAKTHGEGGNLVGAPLVGDTVIIDDVITAGTAIREVMNLISASPAQISGVVVAIDRQERGPGQHSAIEALEIEYGVSVVSIVKLCHIIEYLELMGGNADALDEMKSYHEQYGVAFS